jgi:hypothetical protein
VNTKITGPMPRMVDSAGLGWGPRTCISHELSAVPPAAGQVTSMTLSIDQDQREKRFQVSSGTRPQEVLEATRKGNHQSF